MATSSTGNWALHASIYGSAYQYTGWNSTYIWNVGNLTSGQTGRIVITGTLNELISRPHPILPSRAINDVVIYSYSGDIEPYISNNNSSAVILYATGPSINTGLRLIKSSNRMYASSGDTITWTISYGIA